MSQPAAYLLLVANAEIDPQLRGKIGASDLVQGNVRGSCRDFKDFRGGSDEEVLAWLRRILLNNLANASRSFLDGETPGSRAVAG